MTTIVQGITELAGAYSILAHATARLIFCPGGDVRKLPPRDRLRRARLAWREACDVTVTIGVSPNGG